MKKTTFTELSLSDEMQRSITEMGYTEASPIQAESIPFLMEGRDVIGQAQTGTGKTAAFGIPLIERIDPREKFTSALVMCPTRELAQQVAGEFKKLSRFKKGLVVLAVYGGEPISTQINQLKRPVHIIVGTPGRIMDHLERRTISLDKVRCVVLDEADEMLNMGFLEDMENILSRVPKERQTVLFSATMPKPILEITKRFQQNPKIVKVTKSELTVAAIEQVYFEVNSAQRTEVMTRLIDLHKLQLLLVFCNTKRKVDEVVQQLSGLGYKAEGIHGDMNQGQRNRVLAKFRTSQINVLVATDVAARGIDVEDVDAVFNYDMPQEPEYYVHRIGRTGRAGKKGKAFTFVTGRNEAGRLREIEYYSKVRIERRQAPSRKELFELNKIKLAEKVKELALSPGIESYEKIVHDFMNEGITLHQLAAGLLRMQIGPVETESPSAGRKNHDGKSGKKNHNRDAWVRLFVNVGSKDRISKGDIAGGFAGLAGIHGEDIGLIDLYDKFTFVHILKKDIERVLSQVNGNKIKGRRVNVEIAKD